MSELNFTKLFELVKDSTHGMYRPHSLRCSKEICDDYRNLLGITIGKDKVIEPLKFADLFFIEDGTVPAGEIWACDEIYITGNKNKPRVMGRLKGINALS